MVKNNKGNTRTIEIKNEKDLYDDPDLKEIINRRVLARFIAMYNEAKKEGIEKDKILNKLKTQNILEKELSTFKDEHTRYKQRFKTDYFADLKKAREGNNRALCKLISWDKTWLSFDWVKKLLTEKLLRAVDKEDFELIKGLGEAGSKKARSLKKSKNQDFINEFKPFIDAHGLGDDGLREIKKFHDRLISEDKIGDELSDFDYFVKFLRRHHLIPEKTDDSDTEK